MTSLPMRSSSVRAISARRSGFDQGASVAARRHRSRPARARYGYREAACPSPLDFPTRSSIWLDIQGRRDQFDALADLDRSAMSAEQRASPDILV
jgi:hypothetical protein